MGGGNWSVKDADLHIRLPDIMKLGLQVIAVKERVTVSHIVTQILNRDPELLAVIEKIGTIDLSELSTGEDRRP